MQSRHTDPKDKNLIYSVFFFVHVERRLNTIRGIAFPTRQHLFGDIHMRLRKWERVVADKRKAAHTHIYTQRKFVWYPIISVTQGLPKNCSSAISLDSRPSLPYSVRRDQTSTLPSSTVIINVRLVPHILISIMITKPIALLSLKISFINSAIIIIHDAPIIINIHRSFLRNSTIHRRPLVRILRYIQTQIAKVDLWFVFNHKDTAIIDKKISTDL